MSHITPPTRRLYAIAVALVLTAGCTAAPDAQASRVSTGPTRSSPASPQLPTVARPLPLPRVPYSTKSSNIVRCQHTSNDVILSYDDGISSQKKLNSLLGILNHNNVRAYFFFTGQFANAHPKMIKQIAKAGHVLGNHSYDHPVLPNLSNTAIKRQIARGVAGNTTMKLLRPPYGSGAFTARLQKIAKSVGYAICYWTVDTIDWSSKASPSAKAIVNRVMKGDRYSPPVRKGGVILMHGTSKYGVEATPELIKRIKKRGLKFTQLRG